MKMAPCNPKRVIVEERELEAIEEARVKLYKLLEDQTEDIAFLIKLTEITAPMWRIAHRRREEVD
jgi:hypothetical protein